MGSTIKSICGDCGSEVTTDLDDLSDADKATLCAWAKRNDPTAKGARKPKATAPAPDTGMAPGAFGTAAHAYYCRSDEPAADSVDLVALVNSAAADPSAPGGAVVDLASLIAPEAR